MRRYGIGVTEEVFRRLIRETLETRAPDRIGLLDRLGSRIDEVTRESLRELLADELVASGLGPDDEPNEQGILIEAAIDWLAHV